MWNIFTRKNGNGKTEYVKAGIKSWISFEKSS